MNIPDPEGSPTPLPADLAVTAFDRERRVTQGALAQVSEDLERYCAREPDASILVFDDDTGERIEWPLQAPLASAVPARRAPVEAVASEPVSRGVGRPRLGVVAREVTLLPQDWAWLSGQPGGASAALRQLVSEARREAWRRERRQHASAAAFRCVTVLGEALAQPDEALLALYAGDAARFEQAAQHWPADLRAYVRQLGLPDLE